MLKAFAKLLSAAVLLLSAPPARGQPAEDFERVSARAAEARAQNRAGEAVELYRKALALRPAWAEGWFNLGTLLYDRDAYAEAADSLRRAASLSPETGAAWALLGLCEFRLGRYSEALEHVRRARRLGADSQPQLRDVLLYHEGLLLLSKGDFERAQETLGLLGREGVESPELTDALGLSVLRVRFTGQATADAALAELVRRAGRAEHLSAQKKFEEAQREYERLAADFPKAPNVQYAFGRFLLSTNDAEGGVAALRREVQNTPGHLPARLLIADTKLRLKDFAGGIPHAEEAVRMSPRLALARYLLGSLLVGAGQTARAVGELERAARLMPDEPKIHYALSHAYERAGRREDARRALAAFARLRRRQEGADNQERR